MALTLGDNFSYQGAKPLDARLKYDTLAAMKAVADATMYDGCLAYCVATDKTYQWKSTNTVDPDTGKWSEYSSGGGHEIKNNGVAVTERGVMNFTDFDIADDSTNEETDVKVHRLTQAEMSEIMSTLPGTPTELPVMFDETGAEYVVGWYKLANGTKKPVYEKSFYGKASDFTYGTQGTNTYVILDINAVVDIFIDMYGMIKADDNSSSASEIPLNGVVNTDDYTQAWFRNNKHATEASRNTIYIRISNISNTFNNPTVNVTARYTKTTDTPV